MTLAPVAWGLPSDTGSGTGNGQRKGNGSSGSGTSTPPNTNPHVRHLLTVYSQSKHSNAGTRGLDVISRAGPTLETALDRDLLPAVLSGEFSASSSFRATPATGSDSLSPEARAPRGRRARPSSTIRCRTERALRARGAARSCRTTTAVRTRATRRTTMSCVPSSLRSEGRPTDWRSRRRRASLPSTRAPRRLP